MLQIRFIDTGIVLLLRGGMKILATLFLSAYCYTVAAQTAREVLEKHINAIGGAAIWREVKAIRLKGETTQMGMTVRITQTILNGKGARTDIFGDAQTGFIIVTPVKGWMYIPFGGFMNAPKEMGDDQLALTKGQLNLRYNMLAGAELITSAELKGMDSVNQYYCYQLQVMRTDGVMQTVFIDSKNYNIVKSITRETVNGRQQDVAVSFGKFTQLGNIVLPMLVSTAQGDVNFSAAEVNPTVDESILSPEIKQQ